ncbi:MAG: putative TonB-dependent receptor [Rhodospirillales bacterium]|nr:putative TonB-dependent receptor [Rhodospirillales bacterium]
MSAYSARLRRETSIVGLIGTLTLLSVPAIAQDQPAATPAAPVMEEIVVTGSHIARTNLESTVPVVTLSTAQLQATGITNLADSLARLPQVGVTGNTGFSNTTSNFSDDGAGISTINLRNLGEERTLVLIDGRRTVSGVPVGQGPAAVDLSTIPTYLIDHVDIVTGGGSATYGSEAVAGVVNIVLRDHYEGLMANEQFGLTTEHGDSRTETFDLLTGTSFADDRGHVVFGLEFRDQSAVLSKDRGFAANDTSMGPNGPVYGPSSFTLNGGFGTDNGLFTTLPNGQSVPYNATQFGFNREQERTIQIPTQLISLYGKTSYDITDNVTFFLDGRFARQTATTHLEPIAIGAGSTPIGFAGQFLELPLTNPFIPASLAAQGIADQGDGNGGFNDWRRRLAELGNRGVDDTRTNFAIVTGFKGTLFDSFKWNAAYSYSEMDNFQSGLSGNVVKLQQELNAVRLPNGTVVCADPAALAAGCVPINLFGAGQASAQAINYIKILRSYTDQNKENDLNLDITGPVFSLPYGDVSLAVGFEYRTEDGYNRGDPLSGAGFALDTSQPPSGGGYNVYDYWIETKVPVLKDLPGAKSLTLTGSFRYSDYSIQSVGGKQSYAYGFTYAPVEDVQFRAVNSVAIRAPDLTDLFQGRGNSAVSVNDPCANLGIAGALNPSLRLQHCLAIPGLAARINAPGGFVESINNQQSELSYIQGNPNLTNERAEVLTYGVTFQPRWISGFTASIDAFRYKIANAVQKLDIQTVANQCADTLAPNFCNAVRRNTTGPNAGLIIGVDQEPINVGSFDERGIDVALNYGFSVEDAAAALTGSSWGDGRITIGWNYTYLQQIEITAINGATTNLRGLFGAPKHKWNLNLGYSNDDFDVTWQLRYEGSQSYDGGAGGPTFQPFVYNDFSVHYHLTDSITPYIGVNNVFDQHPPLVTQEFQQTGAGLASGVTGTNTVPGVYDVIGRFIYFGVKFQMPWESAPEETTAYTPPPPVAPAPATAPKSYLVFFDFNKSDLTPQAVAIVDQAAHNAGPAKVTKLEVTGHTDTVGSDAYNMRLSRRRAESVAAQLEKDGIPSSEIEIIAKGKRDLLVPTADGVREPQNRRVQIVYEEGTTS